MEYTENTAVGCVIMASGRAVRFGSNKLLADFGGAPLIVRALDAAETVSFNHLRAHETGLDFVCRLLLEKKKKRSSKQPTLN